MDGCDARHNEEVLLCIINRFVMAITAAEVVPRPALVSRSTLNRCLVPPSVQTQVVGESAFL
jgi:hypothetical protein